MAARTNPHACALAGMILLAFGLAGCDRERARAGSRSAGKQKLTAERTVTTPVAPRKPAVANVARRVVSTRLPALAGAALAKTPLAGRVRALFLGRPAKHGNLTLYPVEADFVGMDRRVLTVDAAFSKRKMEISEEGSANVPFVKVTKPSSDEVFIMTGEMFVGAQQDRIAKHDALLPRRAGTFRLPVYCVEQGRWGGGSRFRTGKVLSTRSLRKTAAKKGSQSAVWGKVASKTGNLSANTPTQTMAASYRSRVFRTRSKTYLKALGRFAEKNPQAVGVLVVINGTVANLDLFANHHLFEALWDKLLKAFVLDAVDPRLKGSEFNGKRPREFLATLARVGYRKTRTPGLGQEYLLSSEAVAGTLLVSGPRLVHLALFPEKEGRVPTRRFHTQRGGAPQVNANPNANGSPSSNNAEPLSKGDWLRQQRQRIKQRRIRKGQPRRKLQPRAWPRKGKVPQKKGWKQMK